MVALRYGFRRVLILTEILSVFLQAYFESKFSNRWNILEPSFPRKLFVRKNSF